METRLLLSASLLDRRISDLIREYPLLIKIFLRHHAACGSCPLASFCNLKDALVSYRLDPVLMLQEINEQIRPERWIQCRN